MKVENLDDRKRLGAIVLIMVTVAFIAAGILGGTLYTAAVDEQRAWLLRMVQSQARIIETVAEFDAIHSQQDHPEEARAATISRVLDAYRKYSGFGESGEFVLGRRTGDMIVFLDTGRHHSGNLPEPVAFNEHLAVPMHLALQGKTGTTIALDYRGVQVLAAYEPVAVLNIGIVTKIDLAEIRAPYVKVALISTIGTLIIILFGGWLTFRISVPMLEKLESQKKELSQANIVLDFQKTALDEHAIVSIADVKGNITYANEKFCNISGYSREELIGKNHRILNSSEHSREFFSGMWRTISNGKIWHGEIKNRTKTGGHYWVHITIVPFLNAHGKPFQYVAIRTDLTERKKTEDALKQSKNELEATIVELESSKNDLQHQAVELVEHAQNEAALREELKEKTRIMNTALHSIDQGVVVWGEDDNLIMCNERYGELWGYPKELTIPGTPHLDILKFRACEGAYGEGDPQVLAKTRHQKLSAMLTHDDEMVTTPDGLIVRCRYFNVKGFGFVFTYTDVTDLKQMEGTLRDSEGKYKQAAKAAKLGHWVWDTIEDRCISCSKELARIHATTVEEFLAITNSSESDTAWSHPEDRERFERAMREANEQQKGFDIKYRIKARDGTVRYVHEIGQPMFNGDGVHILTQGITQDITATKLAEEEISKLSRAVEQSPNIVMITELDGTIEYVNPKFTEVTGYPAAEAIGQNPRILQYGGRTKDVYAEMWNTILSGEDWHGEFRNKKKDGTPIWISTSISSIPDSNGNISRFVAVQEDITERKEVEEALKLSELRYQAVVEDQTEIITRCTPDGLFTFVNEAYCRFVGDTQEVLIGSYVFGQVPEDEIPALRKLFNSFSRKNPHHPYENLLINAMGEAHWFEWTNSATFDEQGNVTEILSVGRNITERKLTEKELQESQEIMRALADNLPEFITLKDTEGRFLFVNKLFEEWVGIERNEIVGKTVRDIYSAEQAAEFEALDQKVMSGQSLLSREVDLWYPDGNTRSVISTRFPLVSSSGDTIGLGTVNIDITERKRAEEALKKSEMRYQAVVEDQTEVILRLTPDGLFTFANEAYCRFVGKQQKDLIGTSIFIDVPKIDIPALKEYFNSFSPKHPRKTTENYLKNVTGGSCYFEWTSSASFDEHGDITEFLSVGRDNTERKKAEEALQASEQLLQKQVVELKYSEEQLEAQAASLIALTEDLESAKQEMQHMANHDALTELPSLRLCRDRLESAMAVDRRNKTRTAVLFIDLDGFKAVNDSLGHKAGDDVLRGVAERLKSSIREVDTAARIGGDEFILVLPETGDKDDIAKIAQKIIDSISEPFTVDGGVAKIGASIGIAFSPTDGATPEELLRNADESMYAIKK